MDQAFDVGVEFEVAGNIWGITSPPEDWFPPQPVKRVEGVRPGGELRLVARTEMQAALARNAEVTPAQALKRTPVAPGSRSPWFSDLMAGLSNQIQITVSEIAAVMLANERSRLMEEFRTQLQEEAAGTIQRVIATANDELARRGLKVLSEAAEATVRTSHQRLAGAIEQNVENARQRMLSHEHEVSQRVAGIATSTLERLQRTFEVSRNEQAERFLSRLREQITPVVEEANADLQRLAASQNAIKEESHAICTRVAGQLESTASATVMQTHNELGKSSAAMLKDANEKLRELSQSFEKVAHENAGAILASASEDAKKGLEERATEISGHFTDQLEGHIRDYLEFIGQTIAEFPKKPPEE